MLGNLFRGPDMLIVMVIVVLVFGPKNLPKLARSVGSSVKELKKGLNGELGDEEAPSAPAKSAAAPETTKDSR